MHHFFEAMARGHDRHRFGRHGPGFMGGRHGDDIPSSRRLGSTELQLLVLALLAERPAHGYELIKTIEDRSRGFYSPSPGVIYPALTFLEEIGRASVEPDGARKLYRLTADGEAHLAAHRATADGILGALARMGERMEGVRDAFAGVGEFERGASEEFDRARHDLKHALHRKRGCGADEARRIARILERAVADIIGQ